MLDQVGLKDRIKHKPTEMSGGQQQRVSIARALIHNPRIIFADEPTGNLDTRTTIEIMSQLRDAAKKNGQTLVMVTHDQDVARFADRIIEMVDGQIVAEKTGGIG
jgi:putative ABC transport system ATP-binding protein